MSEPTTCEQCIPRGPEHCPKHGTAPPVRDLDDAERDCKYLDSQLERAAHEVAALRTERDTARRDLAAARDLLNRYQLALETIRAAKRTAMDGRTHHENCAHADCIADRALAGLPTPTPSANVVTSSIVEAGTKLGTNSGGALDPATIEACANVVAIGCPTKTDTGFPCSSCWGAEKRIRALEGKEGK